jgi:hypothetical protein
MHSEKDFNVRHAQVLSAICLIELSEAFGLHDESVKKLISHMLDLVSESDLGAWDMRGAELEIAGRGDPLPERIIEQLGRDRFEDYFRLIENAVEVGIHDLYGAPTGRPKQFLRTCIEILSKWKAGVRDLSDLFNQDIKGYGTPFSKYEIDDLLLRMRQELMGSNSQ